MSSNAIRLGGLSIKETNALLPKNNIFVGYRGSIAHGMYVPNSDPNSIDDKDIICVYMASLEHYVGFGRKTVFEKIENEWDVVGYEFRKLIQLLLKQNPNVLSLLWLDEKHILKTTDIWQRVLDNKDIFISKKAYHSFTGYAYSQLKRMDHFKFGGYMGRKRKQLVEKHGYDCKNSSHLIRLLRMSIEYLIEGKLFVERKDAANLLAIKRGEWTLEQVKTEAQKLFDRAQDAYIKSTLPNEPDRERAEQLCMDVIYDACSHYHV